MISETLTPATYPGVPKFYAGSEPDVRSRIKAIDGWRTIAASFVVFAHAANPSQQFRFFRMYCRRRTLCEERNVASAGQGMIAMLCLGYCSRARAIVTAFMALTIVYVIFVGNAIGWVLRILESLPLQFVGMGSYSLYLWQQLFLAQPAEYANGSFMLLLLPVVVILPVILVERPFIRIGRRLSRAAERRQTAGFV